VGYNFWIKEHTLMVLVSGEYDPKRLSSVSCAWRKILATAVCRLSRGGNGLTQWLIPQNTDFYRQVAEKLFLWCEESLSSGVDCVKEQCESSFKKSELPLVEFKETARLIFWMDLHTDGWLEMYCHVCEHGNVLLFLCMPIAMILESTTLKQTGYCMYHLFQH
jgi:hypothetical protein